MELYLLLRILFIYYLLGKVCLLQALEEDPSPERRAVMLKNMFSLSIENSQLLRNREALADLSLF
jgi:hypothetical protein